MQCCVGFKPPATFLFILAVNVSRVLLLFDGTCAETNFLLPAEWTSPSMSARGEGSVGF